jgi:tetratricopeptide (TPR) repeat protein
MPRCLAGATRLLLVAMFAAPVAMCAYAAVQEPSLSPASSSVEISPEMRGDLAMAHAQYLEAIDAYSHANLDSAVVWNKLGMAYHHLFAIDQARRDYQHAIALRPNYAEALNNLGAVYYAKKSYRKAEKYYRKALAIDPKSAAIYSNLGTAYFARGKYNEGIEAYRTAFELDPHVFDTTSTQLVSESLPAHERAEQDYCLAKLFAERGHNKQAIEYLRKAFDDGFTDRKKILEDDTLASLRATPEFAQLMTEQKLR